MESFKESFKETCGTKVQSFKETCSVNSGVWYKFRTRSSEHECDRTVQQMKSQR